jgi:hypothetical protein
VGAVSDGGSRVWPSFGSGSRMVASPGGGSRACPSSSGGFRAGVTRSRDDDGDDMQIRLVVVAACDGLDGLMDGLDGPVRRFSFFVFDLRMRAKQLPCMSQIKT